MKWGRELALAAIVSAAGLALYFSVRHDVQGIQLEEQELFPGFEAVRVRCIIAENVQRDWRMRVERDEHGSWRLTDPTAVPGNFWRIEHLLQVALAAHGPAVPASESDPARLGLEPPRMVLEIEELLDGKSHHERVEIGGLDADNRSVNVRVRGHCVRVLRDLDTALDCQLADFKTDLALEFNPHDVVRLRRSGTLVREGASAPADVGLEIELTEEGWRSIRPEGLRLDSTFVATWLQGLAAIHHSGYVEEYGTALDTYGLSDPEMKLELELRDGSKQALRLGRPGHVEGQVWYAERESLGLVWALETFRAYLVGFPLEDMIDEHLLLARREDVTTLTLHTSNGDLYFTPEGKLWHLALRRPGGNGLDRPVLADPAKVNDLLGELEQARLTGFRIGQPVLESPDAPAVWIGVGGLTQGGWFGDATKGQDGTDQRQFQRRGENASSLVPQKLYDSVTRPIESFWSMELGNIPEYEQNALAIQGLEQDLRFQRDKSGRWLRGGSTDEAKELHPVLDALCFLRAARYLPPRIDPPWEQKITVKFTSLNGKESLVEIGRSREAKPGEEVEVIYDKLRAVAREQTLHAKLLEILGQH